MISISKVYDLYDVRDILIYFYKVYDSIIFLFTPVQVMLSLAGLYLSTEDLDACQHQLMTLLKGDKENDSATIVGDVTCICVCV